MDSFFPQHSPHLKAISSFSSLPVPPPPSCCRLCHSPCCQLTPLVHPACVLWCLYLLSAGTSCCPRAHSPPPLAVPLPLVTPLPHVAPLSFGWLSHFPAPQPLPLVTPLPGSLASTIHHASTFGCASLVWLVVALPSTSTPILPQPRLVPRPLPLVAPLLVTVFRVVCCRSRRRFRPIQRLLLQSGRGASSNIAVSIVIAAQGFLCCCRCHGRPCAHSLPAQGFPCCCPCRTCPLPGRGPEEGASPSE